ncbi:MAG: transglutaminase-like cysteine peptidase [Sphingomonadales bacterium]|nr:transglutaminase-like cysteine peptidase [Sphingomonadales bacterium]MBD3774636.1 transglutaminase-like cysteine peptidase [Paracoccaceae bacterium]
MHSIAVARQPVDHLAVKAPAADACARPAVPAFGPPMAEQQFAARSKSEVILGGISRLEQMRLAQQGPAIAQPAAELAVASKADALIGGTSRLEQMRAAQQAPAGPYFGEAEPQAPIAPALGPVVRTGGECSEARFAIPRAVIQPGRLAGRDDFLGSSRLAVRKTFFDADWRRVSARKLSRGNLKVLPDAGRLGPKELLTRVNGWVNDNVTYVEDRDLWGKADYWADARTTLRLRKGDCEDLAILKMQLLAGYGIPAEDMFLTIAKDLVRNADHAVLVVRIDGQYYLLDNAVDQVLDGSVSNEYRPIFTYSGADRWVHGYSFMPQRSVMASPNAFATGLSR